MGKCAENLSAALRRFKMFMSAYISTLLPLCFDNLFASTRGTLGERKAFCEANAALQAKMEQINSKNPLTLPDRALSALPISR
jgi:hypothetical protein